MRPSQKWMECLANRCSAIGAPKRSRSAGRGAPEHAASSNARSATMHPAPSRSRSPAAPAASNIRGAPEHSPGSNVGGAPEHTPNTKAPWPPSEAERWTADRYHDHKRSIGAIADALSTRRFLSPVGVEQYKRRAGCRGLHAWTNTFIRSVARVYHDRREASASAAEHDDWDKSMTATNAHCILYKILHGPGGATWGTVGLLLCDHLDDLVTHEVQRLTWNWVLEDIFNCGDMYTEAERNARVDCIQRQLERVSSNIRCTTQMIWLLYEP